MPLCFIAIFDLNIFKRFSKQILELLLMKLFRTATYITHRHRELKSGSANLNEK